MRVTSIVLGVLVGGLAVSSAQAAVSYSVAGSTYTQDFNSLPTDAPSGANIQSAGSGPYSVNGWQDDSTTVAGNHIGVTGWYLNHPIDVGTPNPPTSTNEGGTNGNQRLRFGPGANTGSFWFFGNLSTSTDKALGDVGSTTVATNGDSLRIGLRLTNNVGYALNEFTVTYDGEQWRDGQGATGETMNFSYMMAGTDDTNWHTAGVGNPATFVPELAFTAPTVAGTGASGTALDGNAAANRIADITFTVTGINWAPGTDLWLRWSDPQVASLADDGLSIDNVRFSAIPEPTSLALLGLGGAFLIRRRSR